MLQIWAQGKTLKILTANGETVLESPENLCRVNSLSLQTLEYDHQNNIPLDTMRVKESNIQIIG